MTVKERVIGRSTNPPTAEIPQNRFVDVYHSAIQAGQKAVWIAMGLGIQKVGMGKKLYDAFDIAKKMYDETDEWAREFGLHFSIKKASFEGPSQFLNQTLPAAMAIDTWNMAHFAVIQDIQGDAYVPPGRLAGFSLGELGVLEMSGAIDRREKLKILIPRSLALQEIVHKFPGGKYSIRTSKKPTFEEIETFKEAVAFALEKNFVVCTRNAPFSVSVGALLKDLPYLENKAAEFRRRGVRITRLPVETAFHSPFVRDAQPIVEKAAQEAQLRDPDIPFYSNVSGKLITTAGQIREELPLHVTEVVDWDATDKDIFEQELHITEVGDVGLLINLALTRRESAVPKQVAARVKREDIILASLLETHSFVVKTTSLL